MAVVFGAEEKVTVEDLVCLRVNILWMGLDKRWRLTYHSCDQDSDHPHVETVVILLHSNKKLWGFEHAGADAEVVLLSGVVELGETPVN